jgi:hypothetical protein
MSSEMFMGFSFTWGKSKNFPTIFRYFVHVKLLNLMKFQTFIRQALPYVVAVIAFWVVSAIYFAPQMSGNTLAMNDVTQYGGMRHDIVEHRAAFNEDPQWTGGMFGGMPAYMITVQYPAMILRGGVQWLLGLMGEPMALMFLAMTGFWIMLLMCGVNPWLSIPFAIAYGLSTYNILIIEAGHITKMRAMGYAPMLVGAVWWTFRRGPWIGGALAALTGALLIAASHHQITYYFLLIVAALWIGELVVTARLREGVREGWRRFFVATGVLVAAAVLAVGANFTHIWYTLEHTPETTRGGTEVAVSEAVDGSGGLADPGGPVDPGGSGLELDYATQWSYGVGESFNMFIPNFRGGSSMSGFTTDGDVANVLRGSGISPSVATELPGYWGTQPFTGGPTYLGAVVIFLAVLAMFVLPGRMKWWIFGVSVLALLLAWGRNAMWFTELAFAVLPGYNKFRTVSMALVVLQFTVPLLAAMVCAGLWKGAASGAVSGAVSGAASGAGTGSDAASDAGSGAGAGTGSGAGADSENFSRSRFLRSLAWATGLTGGVALFFALFGGVFFDFSTASDSYYDGVPGLVDAVRSERAAMLRADCWRSLIFVLLTAGVVWAWFSRDSWRNGVRRWIPVAALSALVLCDLVPVDLRFLSHDDFKAPARVEVTPDEADREIMADNEPGFRVLNTENPFNEAVTSYFHRSVGGYHAAKLRRYQDVIDRYLSRFHPAVLGMLNTKYFIISDPASGERMVERNNEAFGAAWFTSGVTWVDSATAELDALGTTDLRSRAIVDERFKSMVNSANTAGDGIINLTEYRPNYLKYQTLSTTEQVAVFSEIYYNKGWTAYIDGAEAPYFRADYILRAMVVPAGEHTVEWRFRAPRFALVEGITLASSIAILLWLAAEIIGKYIVRKKRTK